MSQIFGEFTEDLPPCQEYIVVGFSPGAAGVRHQWRNNGLSADFLADYLMTFFPENCSFSQNHSSAVEIKSAVSYIANELLENAMQFTCNLSVDPIMIQLQVMTDQLIFKTTNSIKSQAIESFQAFLVQLLESDPQELYVSLLEKSARDGDRFESHIGYLTMITDYGVKLGWKFDRSSTDPEMALVTTMVKLFV
jgi:hypothetical protein